MMKRIAGAMAAAAVCGLLTSAAAQNTPKVIYGDDDRLDIYQVKDTALLGLADSTAALFDANKITVADGTARLATESYGEDMSLCKDEPFYEQDNGAFCSGSLVGPDLLMTAGHCVTSADDCQGTKFVFGFAVKKKGELPRSVPAGEVYGCAELVARVEEGRGPDWALIRLDRAVPNHKPLAIDRSGTTAVGTPLVVIGHPAGLPTKVAGGASVRDSSPDGFFVANLDTYGGNSGSAVFNKANGLIEGILVRGEMDYVWSGNCRRSNVCADDACRGEDVTKISALSSQIPKTVPESLGLVRVSPSFLELLDSLTDSPRR